MTKNHKESSVELSMNLQVRYKQFIFVNDLKVALSLVNLYSLIRL